MDNLILTPNIARELLNTYQQFTRFNKEEVEGLTLADYQKLLTAYGQLYFNTNDIRLVLDRLERLASLNEQTLPTAAVPNSDQLKTLVSEHEKFLREKALHDSSWRERQALQVKEKVALLNNSVVVYPREDPSLIPIRPDLPEEAPEDRVGKFAEQDKIKNIEAIISEAGVGENIAKQTAGQIDQYIKLTTSEGLVLSPQALQERVETFLSRSGAVVTRAQVEQIAERLQTSVPSNTPSPYVKTPRPIWAQTHEEDQQPEKQEARQTPRQQEYLYLIYRGQPYWRTFAGQLSPFSWFGKQKDPTQDSLQLIRSELERIKADEPQNYREYSTIFQAIENRVDQLIEVGTALESIKLVTPENLEQALQNLNEVADQIQRLEFNETTQSFEKQRETKESLISSLPGQVRQTLEEKSFAAEQATRFAEQEARRIRQNLFSNLRIRLKNLLIITSSRIYDFFSFSLPKALGFGARVGSIGIAATVPGSGGSLAILISRMLSGLLNLGSMGLREGAMLTNRALIGLAVTGGAEVLPLVSILAVALGSVFILAIFVTTIQHGVFLKENTSLGIVPESKYIGVTKTADPTSLPNTALPAEVKYTITVTAKEKNLKNVKVNEEFSAYGKNNPSAPVAGQHSINPTIEIGKSESFNFPITLSSEFADSLVTNIVTVTADVEDGPSGEKTSRSAVITIGSPPTGCFVFKSGWNDASEKAKVTEMIGRLSVSPYYMARLCKDGSVDIIREHRDPGWSGMVTNQREVRLYNCSFSSRPYKGGDCTAGYIWQNLFYTFVHETGHVYAWRNEALYYDFPHDPPVGVKGEPFLPTYTLGKETSEDFAETIAVYVIRRAVPNFSGYNIVNMNASYPLHYQFARDKIFNGFDGF